MSLARLYAQISRNRSKYVYTVNMRSYRPTTIVGIRDKYELRGKDFFRASDIRARNYVQITPNRSQNLVYSTTLQN